MNSAYASVDPLYLINTGGVFCSLCTSDSVDKIGTTNVYNVTTQGNSKPSENPPQPLKLIFGNNYSTVKIYYFNFNSSGHTFRIVYDNSNKRMYGMIHDDLNLPTGYSDTFSFTVTDRNKFVFRSGTNSFSLYQDYSRFSTTRFTLTLFNSPITTVSAILPYVLKFDINANIDGETFSRPTFDYIINSTFTANSSSISVGTTSDSVPSSYSLNLNNFNLIPGLEVSLAAGSSLIPNFNTTATFENIILQLLANKWFNHPKAYGAINNNSTSSFSTTLSNCCAQVNNLFTAGTTSNASQNAQKALKAIVEQFIDAKRSSNTTGADASIQFVANDTITFLIYLTATPNADADVTQLLNATGMTDSEKLRFNIGGSKTTTAYEPIRLAIGLVLTAN